MCAVASSRAKPRPSARGVRGGGDSSRGTVQNAATGRVFGFGSRIAYAGPFAWVVWRGASPSARQRDGTCQGERTGVGHSLQSVLLILPSFCRPPQNQRARFSAFFQVRRGVYVARKRERGRGACSLPGPVAGSAATGFACAVAPRGRHRRAPAARSPSPRAAPAQRRLRRAPSPWAAQA